MWQSFEQFIVSVPIWIWVLISFPVGWWIGDRVKRISTPPTAGTLWVIKYIDKTEDYYLEMSPEIPPDQIKSYSHLLFDVKTRQME